MITIYVNATLQLPNNDQWENRFNIKSASSNRLYVIAQNIKKRNWACSCPGWKSHRHCKHLAALELPSHEVPFDNVEVKITH